MNEEVKAYLRELYKRQEIEYKNMAELRLKLFEKGEYKFIEGLQTIESMFSDINRRIANCLEEDYLSPAEFREQNSSNTVDNVD